MSKSFQVGLGFGATSATITTLGLMIGLEASTGSRLAVIGGILTIAVADAFSDALGVHIAKESEGNFSQAEVWRATFFTFLFKAIFAGSFLIAVVFLPIRLAIYCNLVWGAIILFGQSYRLAKSNKEKPAAVISEHLLIAAVVMVVTYFLGRLIAFYFG